MPPVAELISVIGIAAAFALTGWAMVWFMSRK
jgi:hypothetical protein